MSQVGAPAETPVEAPKVIDYGHGQSESDKKSEASESRSNVPEQEDRKGSQVLKQSPLYGN